MKRFIQIIAGAMVIPLSWLLFSFFVQKFLRNPIGNPEAKHQISHLENDGVIFIGPSVFHQRIDEESLEKQLNTNIQLVTSIGQSTLANLALTSMVAERAPDARIFLAAHDREISGKGLHQCWPCSSLPFSVLKSEWQEVRKCFWYDIVLGLLAEFIPAKTPLGFANSDAQMINDGGWAESNKRYLENAEQSMREMSRNLTASNEIPRIHLYNYLANSHDFELIAPPNGRFCNCPAQPEIPCHQSLDSSWIQTDLWLDGGHINAKGARKFNQWLIKLLQQHGQ